MSGRETTTVLHLPMNYWCDHGVCATISTITAETMDCATQCSIEGLTIDKLLAHSWSFNSNLSKLPCNISLAQSKNEFAVSRQCLTGIHKKNILPSLFNRPILFYGRSTNLFDQHRKGV
jgi:hypothetical protein